MKTKKITTNGDEIKSKNFIKQKRCSVSLSFYLVKALVALQLNSAADLSKQLGIKTKNSIKQRRS